MCSSDFISKKVPPAETSERRSVDTVGMKRSAGEVLFAHLVERPDAEIDLAAAALMAGEFEYPHVEVAHYLEILSGLAEAVRTCAGDSDDRRDLLGALMGTLFVDLGFCGNRSTFSDPRDHFLNEVLDRRRGIPISLAIVVVEVGRRVGLEVAGLAFPGHFLVRYVDNRGLLVLDPFDRGHQLSTEDLRERLRAARGPGADVTAEDLEEASTRQVLLRMLTNLAILYDRNDDPMRHHAVIARMLILTPGNQKLQRMEKTLRRRLSEN